MMEKIKINVGIIDDDETKRTQIISALSDGVDGATEEIINQYRDYELVPIEMNIMPEIDDIITDVIDNNINVLLIDYQLSSFESRVDYTGVEIADKADNRFLGFPIFVLTSFEAELYKHEVFDSYKVFDFSRYMNDIMERIELNKKIIEQFLKREKEIEIKKKELDELLKETKRTPEMDDRIMDLDDFLERSLDGESALSKSQKKRLIDNRYDEVLDLIHKVLEDS